jgi:hypothetical protein
LRSAGLTADPDRTRNRLAGTIANLARKGILDPRELKGHGFSPRRALKLRIGLIQTIDPIGIDRNGPIRLLALAVLQALAVPTDLSRTHDDATHGKEPGR